MGSASRAARGKRVSSGCFIRRQPWRNQLHPAIQASVRRSNAPVVLHVRPAFWSPRPAACASMAGQHGVCLAAPGANMENHLVSLHVCVLSRLRYFFLIFTSLSLFFLVTVLVLFWYPFHTHFCISSFLFIVASFHFFLILFFGSPLFIPPYFWKKKSIACVSFFFIFPFSFPFSQPSSFSQHWNSGGSHAEELERPGARPRLKARPQPPLFYPFTCSEPQFTDCVALSEHSIPGGQIALQMSVLMKN